MRRPEPVGWDRMRADALEAPIMRADQPLDRRLVRDLPGGLRVILTVNK